MHDNPPNGTPFKREFTLDAGQVEYIDVVAKHEFPTFGGNPISVRHIVSGISNSISQGRYELSLFAHGQSAAPASKSFVIEVDRNQRLNFRAVNT
jgi:hypothetical protein